MDSRLLYVNTDSWADEFCPWQIDDDQNLLKNDNQKIQIRKTPRIQYNPSKTRYYSNRDSNQKKSIYSKVNTSLNDNLPKLNFHQQYIQIKRNPFWCQSNGFQTVRHHQRNLTLMKSNKQKTQQQSPRKQNKVNVEEQINQLESMIKKYKRFQQKQHNFNTKNPLKYFIKI